MRCFLWSAVAFLISMTVTVDAARAQTSAPTVPFASPAITSVDISQFPAVSLTINTQCPDTLENSFANYRLFEDDAPVKVEQTASFTKEIESRTLIFLDLWAGSTPQIGAIKRELRDGLIDGAGFLKNENDFVTVFHTSEISTSITSVVTSTVDGWTADGGELFNSLEDLQAAPAEVTPLTQLLQVAIAKFDPFPTASKRMIVFSNGYEPPPPDLPRQTSLISNALANNIKIETILLAEGASNSDYLSHLAGITQGTFYTLPVDSTLPVTSTLLSLWQSIPQTQTLCRVGYRSHNVKPTALQLLGQPLQQGQRITDAFVPINVPLPIIQNLQILSSNAPISGTSVTLNISFTYDLKPYPNRKIIQTDYTIEQLPEFHEQQLGEPTLPLSLIVAPLSAGNYTLHIELVDELGQKGVATAPWLVQAPVVESPPSPPDTGQQADSKPELTWWQKLIAQLATLIPLLFALFSLSLLLLGAIWLVGFWDQTENKMEVIDPSLSSSTLTSPGKIGAVLYRTTRQRDMLQVIPINNSITPINEKALFEYAYYTGSLNQLLSGGNISADLIGPYRLGFADHDFEKEGLKKNTAIIRFDAGKYRLIPAAYVDGGIKIEQRGEQPLEIPQLDNNPKEIASEAIITIGTIKFIFYVLDQPDRPLSTPDGFNGEQRGG